MPSSLNLFQNNSEVEIDYRIQLYDEDTAKFGYPAESETLIWTICGADVSTLEPTNINPITAIDYWFSHSYQDYVLVDNITSYPTKSFNVLLTPQVSSSNYNLYMPIMPYISGGTSFQVYTTSNTFSGGKTVWLTNKFEKYVPNLLLTTGGNTLTGILTGEWYNPAINNFELAPISGLIDYYTGNLWIDWSNVPDSLFEPNLSSVYIKYQGKYITPFNIEVAYASAAELHLTIHDNDTRSFYVCCYATNNVDITGTSTVFHPYRIAIKENQYDFTTASLSAVYQSRNTLYCLTSSGFGSTNDWPIDPQNGRAIVWKSEEPNSYLLSAYLPKLGGTPVQFPISGWSVDIDEIQVIASSSSDVFYISATFPDDTLGERTTAVYQFDYTVPISDVLTINTETYTLTSEILKVYRTVTTDTGVYNFDLLSALEWKPVNSFPLTNLTASSGIAINDYTIETYLKPHKFLPLTGIVGLISSVSLYSGSGVLTGYDFVYGCDYLKMEYDSDPDIVYTYSASYNSIPTTSATHTFQVYSAPAAIVVSAIAFNNQPFTRTLTAKVFNDRGGSYVPLHPLNKIVWNITAPVAGSVEAITNNGDSYTFGTLTDDTLIFNISTTTFDLINTFATICAFNIQASAYDTYTPPYTTYKAENTLDFSVDTFPATSLFISKLQLNYETSDLITDMWRVSASPYVLNATDLTTIVGTNVITGTRIIDFGDGRTTNQPSTSINFNTVCGTYDVSLLRSDVSAVGWLSAHSIESNINLHLVTRFISADFMVYPTYVFVTSSIQAINTFTDPITTFGASAYNEGHTEPFRFVALDKSLSSYNWKVETVGLADTTAEVIYNLNTQTATSGLCVFLDVYNNELTYPMPETYLDDNTGQIRKYPNRKATDNLSVTTQNIKLLAYEEPELQINLQTNNITLILSTITPIVATSNLILPPQSPVTENSTLFKWVLSTPKWQTAPIYTATFNYDLTLGYNDTAIGTIAPNATYSLVLQLERDSALQISNVTFAPYDWGTSNKTTLTSENIAYSTVVPRFNFYTLRHYVEVNDSVIFVNDTTQTSAICAFYLYDGYSTSVYYSGANTYDDFTTSYPVEGTFSLYVTAVYINNQTYSMILSDIVHVVSSFDTFDEDITRTFGTTELVFPHSYEELLIPPNEWATAHNFNRSMNRLNDNFEYLKSMTQFYVLPPIDFFGWLGSSLFYTETAFRWHFNYYSDYLDISQSLANCALTAVSDVVFKNNYLYIADKNTISVYNNSLFPTTLNSITLKTFDDPLINIKAIAVDSNNRIYALDNLKNRVVVYGPYLSGDPNSNKFLFEWGGLGGPNAKTKFNNPNDLMIDNDNNIWISDTGNKVVKKYTKTGSFLQTIDASAFISGTTPDTGGIISVAIDSDENIHILTTSMIFKVNNDGKLLASYTVYNPQNATPKKIVSMNDGNFLYICFDKYVTKVIKSGHYAGIFADNIVDANFTSVYQDIYDNVYVANTKNILKYCDRILIERSRSTAGEKYFWNSEDITVDKDENIQDWVCNMVFQRFYDNIEVFRRCLLGKIGYTTNSKGLPEIQITNFTPQEYSSLTLNPKSDIFVGINEIVTSDVLNRCIKQLYNNLEIIRKNI